MSEFLEQLSRARGNERISCFGCGTGTDSVRTLVRRGEAGVSEKGRGDTPGRITRRDFLGGAALTLAGCRAFSWLDSVGLVEAGRHPVRALVQAGNISLENELISAEWVLSSAGLEFSRVEERRSGRAISGPLPAFSLSLGDGEEIRSTGMRLVGRARAEELPPNAGTSRASEHFRGRTLRVLFADEHERLRVEWRAVLREGSHYIRQEITVEARGEAVPVSWSFLARPRREPSKARR